MRKMIISRGFEITPGVCEEVKTMCMQWGFDANEDEGEVKKPRKIGSRWRSKWEKWRAGS